MTSYHLVVHIKRTYSSVHGCQRFNTIIGLFRFHHPNYFPRVFQPVVRFLPHGLTITRLRYIRFETVTVGCGRIKVDLARESVSESSEKPSTRNFGFPRRIVLMSGSSECVCSANKIASF